MVSTPAMPARSGTNGIRCPATRNILVVLRELWSSDILRPSDKIYMRLSVGEPGVGIFPIRKATRLRNGWLQFLERFLVVFHRILEFSDSLLVLWIDNGSPRSGYFLHYSLYGFSIRVGIH